MSKFEYTVYTKASPSLAWFVFTDLHRWNSFANVYGELRWRDGQPWQPGSRLQIELLRPVNAVIDHVITTCVPAKKVGWIDHAIGVAIAQWVTFEDRGLEGTRIHTWGEVVHPGISVAGRSVEELLASFTRTWYEAFRLACNQLVIPGGAAPSDINTFNSFGGSDYDSRSSEANQAERPISVPTSAMYELQSPTW